MECINECKFLKYGFDGIYCSYFNKPLSHKMSLENMNITAYKCDECINIDITLVKEKNEEIIEYLKISINNLEKVFIRFEKEFFNSLDVIDNIIDDLEKNNESR